MNRPNSCLSLLLSAFLIAAITRCAPPNVAPNAPAPPQAPSAASVPPAGSPSKMTLDGIQDYNSGLYIRAFRSLRQASDAGDPEAHVNLGYLHARGQGTSVNQAEALRLYELAAAAESSEGMNAIGYKYWQGTGVEKDSAKAVHWFCKALLRGNPRAMNNLAIMLTSEELPFDEDEARSLWQQAATLGHANAMNNLANSYRNGRSRDAQKAEEWTVRAAEEGHGEAQRYLRSKGYTGALPPVLDWSSRMTPAPINAMGQSKQCSASMN